MGIHFPFSPLQHVAGGKKANTHEGQTETINGVFETNSSAGAVSSLKQNEGKLVLLPKCAADIR